MSQVRTLRPGARSAGAALLAALALLDLAWIGRDFSQAADVTDAWWMWSGLIFRAQDGIWASSFVEPTLLVLYTVCTVTVVVSSAARGILVAAGVLTILLRVPTLWNLHASWVQAGVSDGLRLGVLFSTIAMLVIASALIVLAAAGRRRAASAGSGSDGARKAGAEGTRDEPPARPTRAGGTAAGVLLLLSAVVLVCWETHSAAEQGWELYSQHFTGDRALATLLAVPESWYGCALALIALYAAGAALTRAPHARPFGMTVSGPLLGLGLFRLSFAAKSGLLGDFGELAAREQLWLGSAVFEIVAALGVLSALAARHDGASGEPAHSGAVGALSSA